MTSNGAAPGLEARIGEPRCGCVNSVGWRCVREMDHPPTHGGCAFPPHGTRDRALPTAGPVHESELTAGDAVNHPAHYGGADDPYEAIKVITAWDLNFSMGSAIKYLARAGKKSSATHIEDLQKARKYIDFEIARLERLTK